MICTTCQAPRQPAQRFCGACGAALQIVGVPDHGTAVPPESPALAMASPGRAMGERRDVAILFADLTNFTGLSTEIDAEDLYSIIRSYTRRVDAVVHAFGGVIERYIGDSVMAVFGAPLAHGDDALRSVRAALAIQAEVLPALSLQFGRTLQASIGISFGQVMFTQGEAGHPEGLAVVTKRSIWQHGCRAGPVPAGLSSAIRCIPPVDRACKQTLLASSRSKALRVRSGCTA